MSAFILLFMIVYSQCQSVTSDFVWEANFGKTIYNTAWQQGTLGLHFVLTKMSLNLKGQYKPVEQKKTILQFHITNQKLPRHWCNVKSPLPAVRRSSVASQTDGELLTCAAMIQLTAIGIVFCLKMTITTMVTLGGQGKNVWKWHAQAIIQVGVRTVDFVALPVSQEIR